MNSRKSTWRTTAGWILVSSQFKCRAWREKRSDSMFGRIWSITTGLPSTSGSTGWTVTVHYHQAVARVVCKVCNPLQRLLYSSIKKQRNPTPRRYPPSPPTPGLYCPPSVELSLPCSGQGPEETRQAHTDCSSDVTLAGGWVRIRGNMSGEGGGHSLCL